MMSNNEAAMAQSMLAKLDPAAAAAQPPPSKSGDLIDSHHTLDMAFR